MAIPFKCGACGYSAQVEDAMGGKTGKCPQCKAVIRVPDPSIEPPPIIQTGKPKKQAAQLEKAGSLYSKHKTTFWIVYGLVMVICFLVAAETGSGVLGSFGLVLTLVAVIALFSATAEPGTESPELKKEPPSQKEVDARRERHLARSEVEVLMAIEEEIMRQGEDLHYMRIKIKSVDYNLGCLLWIVISLVVISIIAAIANQN